MISVRLRPDAPARAFTLVELLVVTSIIALLSSIVLAALGDTRSRSRNAARLELLVQYRDAIELAHEDTGNYPPAPSNNNACLGRYATGTCWNGRFAELLSLDDALSPYLPSLPTPPPPPNQPFDGFVYLTCPGSGASCTQFSVPNSSYGIAWMMEGTSGVSCGPGYVISNTTYPGLTLCAYTHR